MMTSSYIANIDYGTLLSVVTFLNNPKKIVEFGILEGYSLTKFAESSMSNCIIEAYDIFDEFNGHHANKETVFDKFINYPNIKIYYGDFYKKFAELENNSIDILHIDIANNGDIYDFVFLNYMSKLTEHGIVILEGGSVERDNVEWMDKYSKPKILPILEKYAVTFEIKTFGTFPSITVVYKKKEETI